jgi:hypothetical protein
MEYVDNIEWKALYPRLTEVDIKYYIFQLLKVTMRPIESIFSANTHYVRL